MRDGEVVNVVDAFGRHGVERRHADPQLAGLTVEAVWDKQGVRLDARGEPFEPVGR